MLTYTELNWLIDASEEEFRSFVVLVAQNYPKVFKETAARVNTGKFDPIETKTDVLVAYEALRETAKKPRRHGAYTAMLSNSEYYHLYCISADKRDYAESRLIAFDPTFLERYKDKAGCLSDWIGELPNFRFMRT